MLAATPNKPSAEPVPPSAEAGRERLKRGALISTFPQPHDISGDGLLTMKETCGVLRCGLSKIYGLINSGQLDSVMIGGTRRITKSSTRRVVERGASVCSPT